MTRYSAEYLKSLLGKYVLVEKVVAPADAETVAFLNLSGKIGRIVGVPVDKGDYDERIDVVLTFDSPSEWELGCGDLDGFKTIPGVKSGWWVSLNTINLESAVG